MKHGDSGEHLIINVIKEMYFCLEEVVKKKKKDKCDPLIHILKVMDQN